MITMWLMHYSSPSHGVVGTLPTSLALLGTVVLFCGSITSKGFTLLEAATGRLR